MRLTALILMTVLAGSAFADATVKARAALALATARKPDPYPAARARAIAEGRPLVVWVGCSDAKAEAATPELLHVRVSSFPGVTSSCVIVAHPSKGELWRVAHLKSAEATPVRLRLLAPVKGKSAPGDCRH